MKWERSKTFDIGGDFKFLNGRLNITADYFRRKTDHLITMLTLPPSTGLGEVYTNLGSLENKGVELEILYDCIFVCDSHSEFKFLSWGDISQI